MAKTNLIFRSRRKEDLEAFLKANRLNGTHCVIGGSRLGDHFIAVPVKEVK